MRIVFVCAEDESLGIGCLSSFLKQNGHEVFLVFDPKQFNRAYFRNQFLAKIFSREKENLKKIVSLKPDLIGFSCVTANYQWALSFAKVIKKNIKNVPIIFGGVHPTLVPELVIAESCVDMVCVGEGEEALSELAHDIDFGKKRTNIKNIWFKKGKKIVKNCLRPLKNNLDCYPPPDKGLFYEQLPSSYKENTSYLSSRGCPYVCTYCGNQQKRAVYKGLGAFVRQKSVGSVIKELIEYKQSFGAKHILFGDDIFAINKNWLRGFAENFKEKVGLTYTCFIHPQVFDEERAILLKESGCTFVWFGIQSGSEEIRKRILNRYETNEEIKTAAKICHKVGLRFMVDHIFDIPFENEENIFEAVELYNDIRPDIINCYNLLYFPKAKIIEFALKAGNLDKADIEKINQGKEIVYQTGDLKKKGRGSRDYYQRYALLLVLIPLFPPWLIKKISSSEKFLFFLRSLPLLSIPVVKVILDFKTGFGFIPFAVIRTEIFFTKRFLLSKLKNFFERK